MNTMTLNITDSSVIPTLLKAIEGLRGVSVVRMPRLRQQDTAGLADGEKWAREVLAPVVKEVRASKAAGQKYPDAYELLKELEKQA